MGFPRRLFRTASLALVLAHGLCAQDSVAPPRHIGLIVARSTDTIQNLASARGLRDGGLLLEDFAMRRLEVFDAMLQHRRVIADTSAATEHAWGNGLTGVVPFLGDSLLVLDQESTAFIVIDPAGAFARLLIAPRAISTGTNAPIGVPIGVDLHGHLIYELRAPGFRTPQFPKEFVGDTVIVRSDSSVIRRVAIGTWRMDTVATIEEPTTRRKVTVVAMGRPNGVGQVSVNPLPIRDDAVVLNDGTIAIIRVRDYHVDLIAGDGHVTHGPKIPAVWVPVTDSMKRALVAAERVRDSANDVRLRSTIPTFTPPARFYAELSDIPSFRSPFVSGSARADADGNLWVMVSPSSAAGGAVYDVINGRGERVEQMQLPIAANLVAFGPGVIYYSTATRPAQPGKPIQLVKARIH